MNTRFEGTALAICIWVTIGISLTFPSGKCGCGVVAIVLVDDQKMDFCWTMEMELKETVGIAGCTICPEEIEVMVFGGCGLKFWVEFEKGLTRMIICLGKLVSVDDVPGMK